MTLGLYKLKQISKKELITMDVITTELEKATEILKAKVLEKRSIIESVQSRLNEVHEIFAKQHALHAALDMPSKNATHSRYKNGLVGELKELEEKKYNILQSILKDGHDPIIGVVNEDGTKQDMKLSEFVAQYDGAEPSKEGEFPPAASAKVPEEKDEIDEELDKGKKAGKFVVYSGGGKPDTTH